MGSSKNINTLMILLITIIITFNLRILWSGGDTSKDDQADTIMDSDCEKPVVISIHELPDVYMVNLSTTFLKWRDVTAKNAKVFAYHRKYISFLTIGIPSVKRIVGSDYLMGTLQSIAEQTSAVEKLSTVVVIFLADQDEWYNQQVLELILKKFIDLIQLGFIQVLQSSKEYYPDLVNVKQNFGDNIERVRWRSKQVADFAFMFMYSENISHYYLQLEDDVICASNFVSSIKKFIGYQQYSWAVLEFSELGFIGKLFRSADLIKLAHFMLTFYQEQPVDWLFKYFRLTMAQDHVILRKPTLFQHMGAKSSFDISMDNKLKDRFFDSGMKKWKSDDPPASLYTTMTAFDVNNVELCYGTGKGYFWAKNVKLGDSLHIIFEGKYVLTRIVVETGHEKSPRDILRNGTVEISPQVLKIDIAKNLFICADPIMVGRIINGRVDIDDLDQKVFKSTKCISITVSQSQENWIIFNQVAVFVKNLKQRSD